MRATPVEAGTLVPLAVALPGLPPDVPQGPASRARTASTVSASAGDLSGR